ncbi:MAG: hypothetical protein ACK417_05555 [Bacteroidia bacterium]
MERTRLERFFDGAMLVLTLLLLSISFNAFRAFDAYQESSGFGSISLWVLPLLGLCLVGLQYYIQRSGWKLNLPFDIAEEHVETAQREARLLLRILSVWMLLIFCGIQLATAYSSSSLLMLLLLGMVVFVDLALLFYFLHRMSKLADQETA